MPKNSESPATSSQKTNLTGPSLSEIARKKQSLQWTRPLPGYIATASRGSIPHLTFDNIQNHTQISSALVGLEDFIVTPLNQSPILSVEMNLHRYLAFPEDMTVVFSARRANHVPIVSSWEDKIEINTIDGRTPLPVDTFIDAIRRVRLREKDIVISLPDAPEAPGVKRLGKMIERSRRWLSALLESNVLISFGQS
jgi:Queuine tRNA-ribosyltransferase